MGGVSGSGPESGKRGCAFRLAKLASFRTQGAQPERTAARGLSHTLTSWKDSLSLRVGTTSVVPDSLLHCGIQARLKSRLPVTGASKIGFVSRPRGQPEPSAMWPFLKILNHYYKET